MISLSIIGVGAFGQFAVTHLQHHFDITLYDPYQDLSSFTNCKIAADIKQAAQSDIIILSVPIPILEDIIKSLASHLKKGQLVMDIASVKVKPAAWMAEHLPDDIDIIATHPIFGPESGKNGIKGLNITLGNIRGNRLKAVEEFCSQKLGLNTLITKPEQHDQEMAYVQGLTHLIAKILGQMDIPESQQTTKAYDHLLDMVNMIKNDSEELFHSIQNDNPYVRAVTDKFFTKAEALETSLRGGKGDATVHSDSY